MSAMPSTTNLDVVGLGKREISATYASPILATYSQLVEQLEIVLLSS
jgi:hypothetical protein